MGVDHTNAGLPATCMVTPEPHDNRKDAVPSLTRTPRNSPGRCPNASETHHKRGTPWAPAHTCKGLRLLWGRQPTSTNRPNPRARTAATRSYVPALQQSRGQAPRSPTADRSS